MEMHVEWNEKESKTECMHILTQTSFKDIPLLIHNELYPTSQAIAKSPTTGEKQESIERHRSLKYQASPQTQRIHLEDGSCLDFTK